MSKWDDLPIIDAEFVDLPAIAQKPPKTSLSKRKPPRVPKHSKRASRGKYEGLEGNVQALALRLVDSYAGQAPPSLLDTLKRELKKAIPKTRLQGEEWQLIKTLMNAKEG